jgi:hypothetical protein
MKRWAMAVLWIVAQIAHVVASVRMVGYIITGSDRGKRILLAYDRLGNAATGGDDKESISSRANRGRAEGVRGWCILCRILDWLDKDHCKRSEGV